ncbi:hypothetical protein [Oricola thermophila]|uniref:DUF4169 family protein n=1 Tax=Oricola thermophila TaxID=2742145 RepID=A0A6N1VCB5_9HYPH|nr:hypothetical protein [Oricola thermophila]QKV17185.1 hypothetical protein HTY61_01235 [Oricola thermophila]
MAEKSRDDDRRKRLAKQLRANLARRKAQARARRAGDADARPEGLPAADKASNSPNKDGGGD